jgi:hypothetical protein
MSAPLRDELRGAILRRDEVARRVETLRGRVATLEAERQAAEDMAADAAKAYRAALTDVADGGQFSDGNAARANRDASASHAADLREATAGLQDRLAALERDHDHAKKLAARAKKALCIELAHDRERALRAAAERFGASWRGWLRIAKSASAAASAEGFPGEPVAMGGPANLLIRAGGLVDDGLRGILARHGVAAGSLQIGAMPGDVLSEVALLGEAQRAADDDAYDAPSPAQ